MYTSRQVAEKLGIAKRTAESWCLYFGFQKIGRMYILNERQFKKIASRAQTKSGRPRKTSEES